MVQYSLIEHLEFAEMHWYNQTCIVNTLIEHSSNKIFTSMLFILEHNTSIMGSMKSIIGKMFGKFPKAHWGSFEHIWLRPTPYIPGLNPDQHD